MTKTTLRARGASTIATAAATAAMIAAVVGAPAITRAASGDGLVIGWLQQASSTTALENQVNDATVFQATSNEGIGIAGKGGYIGIRGESVGGIGIAGLSDEFTGVEGDSNVGDGVQGTTGSAARSGVHGIGQNAGTGVFGESATGVGVKASATSGTALQVVGKATFSRSGRKTITTGHASLVISVPGVTTSSYVIATLQTNRSGVYVRAAVPSAGKVTIYLNKTLTANVVVGFLVIN